MVSLVAKAGCYLQIRRTVSLVREVARVLSLDRRVVSLGGGGLLHYLVIHYA